MSRPATNCPWREPDDERWFCLHCGTDVGEFPVDRRCPDCEGEYLSRFDPADHRRSRACAFPTCRHPP